jgi:hypothetical protein
MRSTSVMSDPDHVSGSWAGYGAALWALIFAAFHIVWATGWYIGLEGEPASTAFAKRWFLVYDLVVAGMCAFAVPVALALTLPWGRRLPADCWALLRGEGPDSWWCAPEAA